MSARARVARRMTVWSAAALTIAGGLAVAGAPAAHALRGSPVLSGCSVTDLNVASDTRTDFVYPTGCTAVNKDWVANAVLFGTGGSTVFFDSWGATGAIPSGDTAVGFYTTDGTCEYVQYVISDAYVGAPLHAAAVCPQDAPIPGWAQGYARAGADAACEDGWNPSWEMWANGGTGGYVCSRVIPSLG